ncbi:MAG: TIGR00282 family metallophosphoesterase [Alphaproteobacteria bacterium]
MRIIFLGDVVGRSGREAVLKYLPVIKEKMRPDFLVVNAENAAHGFGLTPAMADEFFSHGVDVLTTGNHIWDKREIIPYIAQQSRLLRPVNFPAESTPGQGVVVVKNDRGQKLLVVNVMGRLFMDTLDCPFQAMERIFNACPLGQEVQAILVDIHAETTSEKMAMGHLADGRASLVVGTHTHIPTADAQILPKGTAYQTDAGMCGDYNSVIGMQAGAPVQRFLRKMPGERLMPAEGEGTVCGVIVETDDKTGLASWVSAIRLGPRLAEILPLPPSLALL